MGSTGTWCRFQGEDIGAIVRGGSVVCSNPFDHIFSGSDISLDHSNDFSDKTVFLSSKKEEEDPDAADNVCSTASSPRASQYQKFQPISPKKEYIEHSSPKHIGIKSEENDQSPTKTCPSPKLAGIKRRKNQQRSMACVPLAEGCWNKQGGAGVASDHWSWRKYGQKPIKGSPYPRGYYRCSSSKGCPARKQVERSRTDPTMVVITYTADHNHAFPVHRRAVARSSDHDGHDKKEALSLSVPDHDAAIATDHDIHHNHELAAQQHNYSDQQLLISANYNHIFHDDLYQTFEEFPSFFQRDFGIRTCDEEDDSCRMVDPFNLFDWSFSTNIEWPNS